MSPAIQQIISHADIITLQRNLISEDVFTALQYWRGFNIPVVADLDDSYERLVTCNPAFKFWVDNSLKLNPEPLKMLERGLSLCDALTSPNRLILSDWAYVQPRGYLLPNYAEKEWWTNLKDRATMKAELGLQDRIVIGWGGSVSHYDSFWGSGIREAATAICRHNPNVIWMIAGNDQRIYDQLPVHRDNKYMQPGVPAQMWPQIVKTFDIGVAPLFGPYDQRRSWIKTLENGLAGNPWVASAGEPYHDHAALGKLVPGTSEAWEAALEATIGNLVQEQALAEKRVPLYQQWFIENQLKTYEKVFQDVIQQQKLSVGQLPSVHYVLGKNLEAKPE